MGSWMVKGTGPVNAKKLVAKFGEPIFDTVRQKSGNPVRFGQMSFPQND